MRATVSGLPSPLRLALGLFTVGAFGFFGLTMRESSPVFGWSLIGLSVFRAAVWIKEVARALRPSSTEDEEG